MSIEQPAGESMADRIASQFLDQSEPVAEDQPQETEGVEPQVEAEAEAQPEVVEVEFGGKSYRPTHDSCLMKDMRKQNFCVVDQENMWLKFLARVTLIANQAITQKINWPHLIKQKNNGNQTQLTFERWLPEMEQQLAQEFSAQVQVEFLGLEDIFLELNQ